MTFQLRKYRVKPGHMDAFLTSWREGAVPLRQRTGFEVVGSWADPDSNTFVWILHHAGDEGAFRDAEAAYYGSPERAALTGDADPATHLESADTLLMEHVPVETT
jgi:hypothetical protein